MQVVTLVVSLLLAALLAFAAFRKLSHRPEVVAAYARAGVPESWLDRLALILLAAAAGVSVGLLWPPLGVAAAGGVVVYFLVAIAFHLRADDTASLPTPFLLALLGAAVLALQLAAG